MKINRTILAQNVLFKNIAIDDIEALITCLHAHDHHYNKGDWVHIPQPNPEMGIILDGILQISKHDLQGNRMVLTSLTQNDIFAEVFAVAQVDEVPIVIEVQKDAHILWISYLNIITPCKQCNCHLQVIQNLLQILATKNLLLNKKMEYLSCRTIEERILTYLHDIAREHHTNTFEIPFNRQELSDYLCIDRSALSRVLSKLQKERKLLYHKNRFTLYENKKL